MIRVTMRYEYGVETLQTESKSLLAKVAGSIDDNCLAGMFDQHRNTQAFVARVVRSARFAFAGDRRNTR